PNDDGELVNSLLLHDLAGMKDRVARLDAHDRAGHAFSDLNHTDLSPLPFGQQLPCLVDFRPLAHATMAGERSVARPERKPDLDRPPEGPSPRRLRRRTLPPPRRTTGHERRWLHPYWGPFKWTERSVDRFAARHVYPHLLGIWHTYCWLLERRFEVAEATI